MAEYGGAAANGRIPVSDGGRYHGASSRDDLPSGHAIFVRNWTTLLDGVSDARTFARRYRAAGFRWISPVLEPAHASWDEEIAAALAEEEIRVFPLWQLPKPGTWRERLPRFVARARAFGAVAPIPNPEAEWRGESQASARAFVDALRAEFPAVLFSSYGTPQGFPTFPWSAFLENTDAAFPLLFDRDLSFSAAYFERGMQGYRDRGARRVYVAGSTWAHAGRRMKTAAEIARHLLMLPDVPATVLWAPAQLSANRWRVLEAWNRGDAVALEEVARSVRARGATRAPARRTGSGGGAIAVIGILAGLGALAVAASR